MYRIPSFSFFSLCATLFFAFGTPAMASMPVASQPIVTDSRIKTFVYNENDVYNILTHYGYQSNIELGPKERIVTISLGDRVAWQIVPAGNRIFIRALEEKAHTNMTIVTNKRAYQFDLRASGKVPLHPSEELVYVVRFFYPDASGAVSVPAVPKPVATPAPVAAAPVSSQALIDATSDKVYNYRYTYSGDDRVAPLRIYDDGSSTYFKMPQGAANVAIAVVGMNGQPRQAASYAGAAGVQVVPETARQFQLIYPNGDRVSVFNEK